MIIFKYKYFYDWFYERDTGWIFDTNVNVWFNLIRMLMIDKFGYSVNGWYYDCDTDCIFDTNVNVILSVYES